MKNWSLLRVTLSRLARKRAPDYNHLQMAENKLQHYVPKCHMRPFSLAEGRASINVYNIDSDRCIPNAPIKGQCARDYFYGKDLQFEKALQGLEGVYAAVVKKAAEDPTAITKSDLVVLREFTLLQTYRTYAYVEKLMAVSEMQHADLKAAASGKEVPEPAIKGIEQAVMMGIGHYLNGRKHVKDLEMCLVVNSAQREFITSDDPAILTNRFHFQKLRSDTFGLVSAGTILFLPLTPRLGFIAVFRRGILTPLAG
ncbi:DUF4238 domain-containing protein [Rhizobium sp. BR 315]|uniref:DUF4238 domain-containing protein n=1 Tax=Rhizobium sp. BR 315 TaxID=3040014 RepID=UPI003D3252CF